MSGTDDAEWTRQLPQLIRAACLWEATAPKPGNVHPGASFADVCFEDFARSAEVAAPVLASSARLGVGRAIRETVAATQRAIGKNTNLGIILLLAPLAAVPSTSTLADGIEVVLQGLTVEDAVHCYAAIREARPGGLGGAAREDVANAPTVTLREAMQMAADRDTIAAQYVNGFSDVLCRGITILQHAWQGGNDVRSAEAAIVRLHLQLMAELPDTLIARKCGRETAEASARRAQTVLDAGWPHADTGRKALSDLDVWLRSDGNRRNPGTTADLVAATIFAALRDDRLAFPEITSRPG
ncbi:MAG: triphosphoribosyl-dephospho-CoA synthase [Planctomycetaceae bacterium]|nr:triphosphoribosyl-dephospho-CoA synthase [Planctomycetaceae bacterium]